MRLHRRLASGAFISSLLVLGLVATSLPITASPPPTFTLTPLLLTDGSSEPEISIGGDGTTAMVSLQWLFNPASFGAALWTGVFGAPPTFQGIVDNKLQHPGKTVFGAGDAAIDIGSTGRVHHNLDFSREQAFQGRTTRRVGHHVSPSGGRQPVDSQLHVSNHRHGGVRPPLDHVRRQACLHFLP